MGMIHKNSRTTGKRPRRTGEKVAQNTGIDFLALRLGVVLSLAILGPETARWGGGLPREGVVAENFVPALETLSSLGFEERNPGCPGNFAGMCRTPGGAQKVCAKKLRALLSFPILEPQRDHAESCEVMADHARS